MEEMEEVKCHERVVKCHKRVVKLLHKWVVMCQKRVVKFPKQPKGEPRAKHKCLFPSCASSAIHLPRHMADSHGWSKKDASTVLNIFALRKERVKPSKIKRYVKSIQCPFPRCHSVVKRIYNHLYDVHKLKPATERYKDFYILFHQMMWVQFHPNLRCPIIQARHQKD